MKPFVLIPLYVKDEIPPWGVQEIIRRDYYKKIDNYGLIPLFVSFAMSQETIDRLYELSSGILITGGPDIHPSLYSDEVVHPETKWKSIENDLFFITIIKRALQDKKPLFGICKGMQALAIASGGTLYQHVPDIKAFEGEHHGFGNVREDGSTPLGTRHEVIVDEDSKAFTFLEEPIITTLSEHHQAVKTIGNDLVVAGKSPAGVIEILEHKDKTYFCFGIQGHPEAEQGQFEVFFDQFAKAVKEQSLKEDK